MFVSVFNLTCNGSYFSTRCEKLPRKREIEVFNLQARVSYDGLQGTRCKHKRNHANKKENTQTKKKKENTQLKKKTRKQKRKHANKKETTQTKKKTGNPRQESF